MIARPTSFWLISLALVSWCAPIRAEEPVAEATETAPQVKLLNSEETEFFEQHIRPLLVKHCYECHSSEAKNLRGGLLLDSRQGWQTGGDSGPAIVPGSPLESLLIQAIEYGEEASQMPPRGKLPAKEIALLTEWVKRGAPDPRTEAPPVVRKREIDLEAGRKFWAFVPPVEPQLPTVQNTAWPRSPIDRFILAELEAANLQPAPPADKRTLLRRVTFDLVGLPPTADELATYLADDLPDAYERAVERLLASPHYGERWARHWLDIARYADSNGFDENMAYGNAWKYRDYVVQAMNEDRPYNEFLIEQLAGDLLPVTDDDGGALRRRRLIATGFLALGAKVVAEPDKAKMAMDIVDEQLDTVGRSLMGLTLGCARCHDHKFDPIPTTDYYAMAGIFRSTRTMEDSKSVVTNWYENVLLSPEQQKRFGGKPAEMPSALGVTELPVTNLKVHIRGDHLNLGAEVPRGFLQVLSAGEGQRPLLPEKQSGRFELAQWLTRPDHPLTARVLVNRLWRWHFGTGLVRTPDNFGLLGERPTNGPLLDWLAVQFVKRGWSIKAMHRLLVLSSTYRMSSTYDAEAAKLDPENRLYWRMNLQRLSADQLRDALLVTAGKLDRTRGGSLLKIKNRDWVFNHTSQDATGYESYRRSLYLPVIRNHLYEAFQLFDFPDPNYLSGDRATTTVAPQALFFLNSHLVMQLSGSWANDVLANPALADDPQRIASLYRQAYGREPNSREVARSLEFLARCEVASQSVAVAMKPENESSKEHAAAIELEPRQRAWQMLGQTLISASEFLYVR
jgi:hypothetical protein